MKRRKRCLPLRSASAALLAVCLAPASASRAEDQHEPPEAICQRLLSRLQHGEVQGFELAASHMLSHPPEDEYRILARKHAAAIQDRLIHLGKPLGYELLSDQTVGTSLRKYTYLCKYERGFFGWEFHFYRPGDSWKLVHFQFFSESGKFF